MAAKPEQRHLLVLGCSKTKNDAAGPLPALYRYDGPLFQDLRAHLRDHVWPRGLDIAVLSAEFGLIGALTEIESYDRRMSESRAAELAPAIATRIETWRARYGRISLCLGKDYLAALPMERLNPYATEIFEGPIGVKRQRLGAFLRRLNAPPRRSDRPLLKRRLTYFLPDWDDLLDPDFDFAKDCFSRPRESRVEHHCARLMRPLRIADGMLLSLAQKREAKGPLYRVNGHDHCLRPIDLRAHYALDRAQALFGDCGAFSYIDEEAPPFSVHYAVSLYELYNFDYGASVDHIPVQDIVRDGRRRTLTGAERRQRVATTIANAEAFLATAQRRRVGFNPVGTVQGLSPEDYAANALAYAEMGYRRIALGGLVPLNDASIQQIVSATMKALSRARRTPRVHLFGVFRPKLQNFFRAAGVASFDSATYFRKAWLRSDQNYLATNGEWYGAIRVPMTTDGRTRNRLLETGADLVRLEGLEAAALAALTDYGRRRMSLRATLSAVAAYDSRLTRASEEHAQHLAQYERTLGDRPWEHCPCPICTRTGIDVVIFRGSNRNKRRGAHNTWRLYCMIRNGQERAQATPR